MKIFNLDEKYNVVCNSADTRNGFKHVASLCRNGERIAETKICYLNRTWERFTYESVLEKIVDENFSGTEKEKYQNVIKKLN
jgi:hypothetical protein